MRHRTATLICILVFLCAILCLIFLYGPHSRIFLASPSVESAALTAEIGNIWERAGVRGRTAVLLTRHLNSEVTPMDAENEKFLDIAMKHGVVRTAYHVLPDSVWQPVSENLSQRSNVRSTTTGFVMVRSEGRIYIQPLSRFRPLDEECLTVVEPGVWNTEERGTISRLFRTGALKTDLLTIIRGASSDTEHYRSLQRTP